MPAAGTGMGRPFGLDEGAATAAAATGEVRSTSAGAPCENTVPHCRPLAIDGPPGGRGVTLVVTTVTGRVTLFLGGIALMHVFDVAGRIPPVPAESAQVCPTKPHIRR
jgi:hypothetical protein